MLNNITSKLYDIINETYIDIEVSTVTDIT